jgi:cephalosporin hydroxylase
MIFDKKFNLEKLNRIESYKKKSLIKKVSKIIDLFTENSVSYNYEFLGIPIIQYPEDMIVMQELIFNLKPDLIIEIGVARGGGLAFYSLLQNFINKSYKVLGIDLDIRDHTKKAIKNHKLKNILTIEGSSIDPLVFKKVNDIAKNFKKVIVILDSKHTHDHVLKELNLYSSLVKRNSYIVVCDTTPHFVSKKTLGFIKRNYKFYLSKKSNANTAIEAFISKNKNYIIDEDINNKLLITNLRNGFLKRVK